MIMIIIMHNYNNVNDNHNADLFITRTHNVIIDNVNQCTKFDVRRVLRLIVIHI